MTSDYNKMGLQYIAAQQKFVEWKKDEPTQFLKQSMEPLFGKTILDVGCGAGEMTYYLQQEGADMYGVDKSEVMLNEAKKLLGTRALKGDHLCLPFPDNSFDGVVSRFSIHYAKDLDRVYYEYARVLKPGGKLAFITQHPMHDAMIANNYKPGNEISITLFEEVELTFPTHTIEEYLSPAFFRRFHLTHFHEGMNERGYSWEGNTPCYMGLCATRV